MIYPHGFFGFDDYADIAFNLTIYDANHSKIKREIIVQDVIIKKSCNLARIRHLSERRQKNSR